MPLPFSVAHAVGERGHLIEYRVYLGDNIHAVHLDLGPSRSTQSYVQHCAAFREIDLLAAEHCVATNSDAPLLGQMDQQPNGFISNSILRVVEIKAGGLGSQSVAAAEITGKQLS